METPVNCWLEDYKVGRIRADGYQWSEIPKSIGLYPQLPINFRPFIGVIVIDNTIYNGRRGPPTVYFPFERCELLVFAEYIIQLKFFFNPRGSIGTGMVYLPTTLPNKK